MRWEESELEYLGFCPICGSKRRRHRYKIDDWYTETEGDWDYYQCQSCGVFYIDPRPNAVSIGKLYNSYFTHEVIHKRMRSRVSQLALGLRNDYLNWKYGYNNTPAIYGGRWLMYLLPPWFRWEWDFVARHLKAPQEDKDHLLDVGCGNGEFLAFAKAAGWQCVGVDFDPQAVATAHTLGVRAYVGDLESQQFPNESFDAITLSHVIEHFHDPRSLLYECKRLLRPEGILWIATPNVQALARYWFGENWLDFAPHHLVLFSPNSLYELLDEVGFKARLKPRGAHVQAHFRASRARQKGLRGYVLVCLPAFLGSKSSLIYQPLELIVALWPRLQGDIVITATKKWVLD